MADTNFVDQETVIQAPWLNDVNDHVYNVDTTDVHPASSITNTPAGSLAATTVQAALNELDTEKEATANKSTTLVADLASNTKFPSVKSVYDWVTGFFVAKTSSTGSAQLPVGTTAQEDGAIGSIRYDSTLGQFRGKGASGYALLGGGATGGGSDTVFVLNGNTINNAFTVPTGSNAHTVGPITINALVTLNGRWVIS